MMDAAQISVHSCHAVCDMHAALQPHTTYLLAHTYNHPHPSHRRRAFAAFTAETEQRLSSELKRNAYRSILFGLCFYHSLLLGRKKFGVGIGTGEAALGSCIHPHLCQP
jgi:hypothetical protein